MARQAACAALMAAIAAPSGARWVSAAPEAPAEARAFGTSAGARESFRPFWGGQTLRAATEGAATEGARGLAEVPAWWPEALTEAGCAPGAGDPFRAIDIAEKDAFFALPAVTCTYKTVRNDESGADVPITLGVWYPPGGPPNATAGPDLAAVVYVHGGGWRGGSSFGVEGSPTEWAQGQPKGALLRALQLPRDGTGVPVTDYAPVVVSIDYRLTSAGWAYGDSNVLWPAQRDDVLDAVAFVKAHAGALRVDAARVGCMGESAGAHICTTAAILGAGEERTRLAAAAVLYPPVYFGAELSPPACCCDPEAADEDARPNDDCVSCAVIPGGEGSMAEGACASNAAGDGRSSMFITALVGKTTGGLLANKHSNSLEWSVAWQRFLSLDPTSHLTDAAPPFYIAHGTADQVAVYSWGGEYLYEALSGLSSDRRDVFDTVQGAGHGWNWTNWDPITMKAGDYFAAELRRNKPSPSPPRPTSSPPPVAAPIQSGSPPLSPPQAQAPPAPTPPADLLAPAPSKGGGSMLVMVVGVVGVLTLVAAVGVSVLRWRRKTQRRLATLVADTELGMADWGIGGGSDDLPQQSGLSATGYGRFE